jgi:hypothetical protein
MMQPSVLGHGAASRAALAALALVAAPMAFAQQQAQTPAPLPSGDPRTSGSDAPDEDLLPARTGVPATARFGVCVADASPGKARDALTMDFTSPAYRRAMDVLIQNNGQCFGRRGQFRGSRLLLAGRMAERLLTRETMPPLNARLARAAMTPAVPARSENDAMAICIVRSAPDEVATLLSSDVASPAEKAAIDTLLPIAPRCWQGKGQLTLNPIEFRASVATAAFRSVDGAAGQKRN